MLQKINYFNSLAHRLQVFPDDYHFKLFVGQCYVKSFGRARLLDDMIRSYFSQFTQSQKEFLLAKYEEYILNDLIEKWEGVKCKLTPEKVNWLFTKIKYQKIMKLNVGFNEKDYQWPLMFEVFNALFTNISLPDLKKMIITLPTDLQTNIFEFQQEINAIKNEYIRS